MLNRDQLTSEKRVVDMIFPSGLRRLFSTQMGEFGRRDSRYGFSST